MIKKLAASSIDFADSELRSFKMDEKNNLKICLNSWDDKTISIDCSNVIYCAYKSGFQITDLYEITDNPFLEKIVSEYGRKELPSDSYKFFQIDSLYRTPLIEFIATGVNVIKDSKFSDFISLQESIYEKKIIPNVRFLETKLTSFSFEENNDMFVDLEMQDGKKMKITFFNIDYFFYKAGSQITAFHEFKDSPTIEEHLLLSNSQYLAKSLDNSVLHFMQLEDSQQRPVIEVIGPSVNIEEIE